MPSSHTPRRIACLQPSATVILAALGELDRVVACTKYCADVVPEITAQPRIILADSWTANAEQIIATQPDLVIASVPYQEKAVIEILKSGISFLGLAPKNLADVYADIAIVAGAVGASDRGEEVIVGMQQHIEQVRARTAGVARPKVFCEEWGKPLDRVASMGCGAGGSRWGRVPGRARTADFRRGGGPHESGYPDRRLVRSGRPHPAGENRRRPQVAGNSCCSNVPCLLRSRRAPQHAGSHASRRSRRSGFCYSSRTLCLHERNPPDYLGSIFHSRESPTLS